MTELHRVANGLLRIGQGKENVVNAVSAVCPYGDTSKVEICVSTKTRQVWVRLDVDSARALAHSILHLTQDHS